MVPRPHAEPPPLLGEDDETRGPQPAPGLLSQVQPRDLEGTMGQCCAVYYMSLLHGPFLPAHGWLPQVTGWSSEWRDIYQVAAGGIGMLCAGPEKAARKWGSRNGAVWPMVMVQCYISRDLRGGCGRWAATMGWRSHCALSFPLQFIAVRHSPLMPSVSDG